jgi:hypothetical protein
MRHCSEEAGWLRNVLPNDVKGEMIIGIESLVDPVKQDVFAMKINSLYIDDAIYRNILNGNLTLNRKWNK